MKSVYQYWIWDIKLQSTFADQSGIVVFGTMVITTKLNLVYPKMNKTCVIFLNVFISVQQKKDLYTVGQMHKCTGFEQHEDE